MRHALVVLVSAALAGWLAPAASAQVTGNPPNVTIIRWEVFRYPYFESTVVYDRDAAIGTLASIRLFDHFENDIVQADVDVSDPDWIQEITVDPQTGQVNNGNEAVFLRMRAFGLEQFGPPSPPPLLFPREGWFPDDEGFRPIPGPTTPYHFYYTFEFLFPEFIGRNQARLRGEIDFDVAYLIEFCATNEKTEDQTKWGCTTINAFVLENPEFRPPNPQSFADAGPDRTVAAGTTVRLDGSRTFDAFNIGFNPADPNVIEKDQIVFSWEWMTGPVRVDPSQADSHDPVATVVLNSLGEYVFRLTVADGSSDAVPSSDVVVINVVESIPPNNPPTAVIVGPANAVPLGAVITLDGSQSSDPDGDPLTYRWRQTNEIGEPLLGADLLKAFQALSGVDGNKSTWQAVTEGTFYFRLLVDDGEFLVNTTFTVRVANNQTSGRTELATTSSEDPAVDQTDASGLGTPLFPTCGAGLAPLALTPLALLLMRRRYA
ncbi:MAG: hypothetical protein HZB38_04405 [Planctomycetes bacterium]|nr:hypothetical protein [Planctomycetota bacterium]